MLYFLSADELKMQSKTKLMSENDIKSYWKQWWKYIIQIELKAHSLI